MHNSIVAIATATGVASISIIRVSGKASLDIAQKISHKIDITPRYAHLTSLYNNSDELIDRAIMILFTSPNSFTGEDIVEFQCHGGLVVAQEILDTITSYGVRLAQAGEFSKRAFLNGKIDLTEAEAISKLIEAKSVDAVKILAKQMRGELREFVDKNREGLLKSLAYSEVLIDYAEEDIPTDIMDSITLQLDSLTKQIDTIVETTHRRRGLIEGFRVAIVGKPNVGKSSLLNALLSYDRAIVSDIAGTTRDTIEEQIRIGSHIIRLVDTAGIRDSEDTIEKIGIERSLSSIKEADVVVVLFDNSSIFDEEDAKMLSLMEELKDKHILVALNKSDLPSIFDQSLLSSYEVIEVSAKRSFVKLTDRLKELFDTIGEGDELMLISSRQVDAVNRTKLSIQEAKRPLLNGELEFFSYHLQEAIKSLSSISKPYDSEEILDKMFGEFCLGK
ncbi:MAG: tRNA uridine-5-carboxymethylaminomethyl(34) synthesis GTPase MnmE [Sulfurovum sp.]